MRVRLTAKVAPLASRAAALLRYLRYLVIPPHQVESLLASRDACMLRSSYHAAMLDRRALAKLGVELETKARTWTLKAQPRQRLKVPSYHPAP